MHVSSFDLLESIPNMEVPRIFKISTRWVLNLDAPVWEAPNGKMKHSHVKVVFPTSNENLRCKEMHVQ